MSIRVATYNIRLGIQQGLAAVAEVLEPERAQIIALQEVGRNWVMGPGGNSTAELARRLQLPHYIFVPSLTRDEAHYGHALLSAFPIQAARFDTLPRDVDEPRTMLEAHLEHPDGVLRIISTHLSHIDDRFLQGRALIDRIVEHPNLPTLIMGDLNAARGLDERDDRFLDALLQDRSDADPTATATFPAQRPERRIDYIVARDGELLNTSIGTDDEASDHLYVASTWRF